MKQKNIQNVCFVSDNVKKNDYPAREMIGGCLVCKHDYSKGGAQHGSDFWS